MNRKDMVPFLVLLTLLLAWPIIDRVLILDRFYDGEVPARAAATNGVPAEAGAPIEASLVAADAPAQPDADVAEVAAADPAVPATAPEAVEIAADAVAPRSIELTNSLLRLVFSSRGGALQQATLLEYNRALGSTDPVVLDLSSRPGLVYEGLAGLGEAQDFAERVEADGSIVFEKTAPTGLRLDRTIRLEDRYVFRVSDRIVNVGAAPVVVPEHALRTGVMFNESPRHTAGGMMFLSVDTLSPGGERVRHWGGRIAGIFERIREERHLVSVPRSVNAPPRDMAVDWVAAKNKYFVQILTPQGGADNSLIYARRELTAREMANPDAVQKGVTPLVAVAAAAVFATQELDSGAAIERSVAYYVGPKKYSELRALALHQADVMEFGDWIKPISKLLLRVLNLIHDYVPPYNYGVAIILLTLIVRIVFWPITHKSTESMRRMAQVAPLVAAIREKHKSNPQKQQQEIMALYKEHKVNPLSGCLPMLVQIPVFFALFTVLRSAIELRFASFLWIRDLSEPEGLFAGMIPFVGSLNLLPLLMAFTMWLQMKLSPSTGDPVQQKIMSVMMPIMMLVFLYNFASGLALYWTTQNILMIVQQIFMKRNNPPVPVPAKV